MQRDILYGYVGTSLTPPVFGQGVTSESIISPDEYRLFERLAEDVSDDSVIAVNPWNGGSLAYAFSDRTVLEYH